MSKRISRECALGPDWTGNGLSGGKSPFCCISEIDFSEVSVDHYSLDPVGTIFTVSSCGKFLMASNGCLIYIYEINRSHQDNGSGNHPGHLRPITSVICPRRVLACSMDTSSERYAIAALLDGRMGIVCDFASHVSRLETRGNTTFGPKLLYSTKTAVEHVQDAEGRLPEPSILDRVSLNSSSSAQVADGTAVTPFVFPGIITSPVLNSGVPTGSLVLSEGGLSCNSSETTNLNPNEQLPGTCNGGESRGRDIQSFPLKLVSFSVNAMPSE